ncbi:unnamed protein product [Pleuronectes platessa]|uniref:Uncharacterized protein n=1 Tax=Pleuronectes platessa TaxID=8262 RepID=A0A9N7VYG2_PLEPL|nr:unnamed protein product [Pleuronectes platessa]
MFGPDPLALKFKEVKCVRGGAVCVTRLKTDHYQEKQHRRHRGFGRRMRFRSRSRAAGKHDDDEDDDGGGEEEEEEDEDDDDGSCTDAQSHRRVVISRRRAKGGNYKLRRTGHVVMRKPRNLPPRVALRGKVEEKRRSQPGITVHHHQTLGRGESAQTPRNVPQLTPGNSPGGVQRGGSAPAAGPELSEAAAEELGLTAAPLRVGLFSALTPGAIRHDPLAESETQPLARHLLPPPPLPPSSSSSSPPPHPVRFTTSPSPSRRKHLVRDTLAAFTASPSGNTSARGPSYRPHMGLFVVLAHVARAASSSMPPPRCLLLAASSSLPGMRRCSVAECSSAGGREGERSKETRVREQRKSSESLVSYFERLHSLQLGSLRS